MKIPLFDIDWTLLAKDPKRNIHNEAFFHAFKEVYGLTEQLPQQIDFLTIFFEPTRSIVGLRFSAQPTTNLPFRKVMQLPSYVSEFEIRWAAWFPSFGCAH